MAADKDRVMEMVEAELAKNPSISSEELYKRAQDVDASIGDLNLRQFHARYPLQVKRRAARAGKATAEAAKVEAPKAETTRAESAPAAPRRGRRAEQPKPRRRSLRRQPTAPEPPAATPTINREVIRAALLQFAEAVAAADDAAELVKVVGSVERYVDRVARATGEA